MSDRSRSASKSKQGGSEANQAEPSSKQLPSKSSHRGRIKASGSTSPGLTLVATPIGNLGDMSRRAIEALSGADLVLCEDTRVTGKLLRAFSIEAELLAYHDHNAERVRPKVMARLAEGASIALVSDAGTPLVSDPGYRLVRACHEAGVAVTATPGPSAPITALCLSGLPSDRFLFAGFPPQKSGARRNAYAEFKSLRATLIFFESAKRLADSLADAEAALGDRPAAVARELTKLHEEVRRGALSELAAHYRETGAPKGEIVIVIGPSEDGGEGDYDDDAVDAELRKALETMSLRDAASAVAGLTGRKKREIYARALALAEDNE